MDFKHPLVQDTLKKLELEHLDPIAKAVKIFYFVRDSCHYNMYATTSDPEAFKASAILEKGEGWCLQKAVLFATLTRAVGIPSRLILVSIRNHKAPAEVFDLMGTNVFFPHMYNDLYLNNQWVKAAATFDASICHKINVSPVEFDGHKDAILPSHDKEGKPYIEYLENFGVFEDIPWSLILSHSKKIYGSYAERWF